MKLQVITVSVNYADFLVHTLETNASQFDKWFIVTDLKDTKTVELCSKYKNVVCIQTDVFYTKGIFNKYAGINEALLKVERDAWVLFLDSDIILHSMTRRTLNSLKLDEEFMYGIDRLNCYGMQEWIDYKNHPTGMLVENWKLQPLHLEMGTRLVHHYGMEGENGRFEGWRPLGYFQLCHRSRFPIYDFNTLGADHCDLEFARRWHRDKRALIPELYCIHLESEERKKAINWYGRKSSQFVLKQSPVDPALSVTNKIANPQHVATDIALTKEMFKEADQFLKAEREKINAPGQVLPSGAQLMSDTQLEFNNMKINEDGKVVSKLFDFPETITTPIPDTKLQKLRKWFIRAWFKFLFLFIKTKPY